MAIDKKEAATKKVRKPRKGYTKVYNAFLDSEKLTQYDKMVFIAIKSFADNITKQAFPSLATISRISGTSLSQVRRSIAKMKNMGILTVTPRHDDYNNGNMSNLYTLHDAPEMWDEDFSTEEDDFRAVAMEIPDHILEAEYIRRHPSMKKAPISETDQSTDIDTSKKQYSKFHTSINTTPSQEAYSLDFLRNHYNYQLMMSEKPQWDRQIDYVIQILYDTLNTSKETIRVQQTDRPKSVVVSQLLKLTYEEILYVLEKYAERTDRIVHPKAYLLTQLYEAAGQYDADVKNQAKHDMYINGE